MQLRPTARRVICCLAVPLALALVVQHHLAGHSEDALLHDWRTSLPPWVAFSLGTSVFRLLEALPNAVVPAPIRVMDMSLGIWRSQVIATLAELGVADILKHGPKTAAELASLTGVADPDKMFRLMRAAVGLGIFAGDASALEGPVRFRNNRLSAVLREDHPNTVKWMLSVTAVDMHKPWGALKDSLQQGQVPFEAVYGQSFWAYLQERPDRDAVFSQAMATADGLGISAMASAFPWGQYERVIDVGGAHGSFLARVLEQHPALQGVLFDLPKVAERAQLVWQAQHADLSERTSFVGGSFLQEGDLPSATSPHDVYVLRNILHDWTDDHCISILKSVKAAVGDSNATLAVIENVLAPGLSETMPLRLLEDIAMLVTVDGKERTRREWEQLLSAGGFHIRQVHAIGGVFSILEAEAV